MNFPLDWDDEPDVWSNSNSTSNTIPIPIPIHQDISSEESSNSLQIDTTSSGSSSIQTAEALSSAESDYSDTPTISNKIILPTHSISHPTTTTEETSDLSQPDHQQHGSTLSISTHHLISPPHQITSDILSPIISPSNNAFSSPSDGSSIGSVFSAANELDIISPPDPQLDQTETQAEDDDDFGDFDDGDHTRPGDDLEDSFGTFASISLPTRPTHLGSSYLPPRSIVPFKLPTDLNIQNLTNALTPALDSLFSSSSPSSPFLSNEPIEQKLEPQPSSSKSCLPTILRSSDQLQQTWISLTESGNNGLGLPIDWKRSQTRRHFLVNLGIPVDLNDFLTPTPLTKMHLSLETTSISSQNLSSYATSGPSSSDGSRLRNSSPVTNQSKTLPPIITLDRKRCDELIGLKPDELKTSTIDKLTKILEELKDLNKQTSDVLSQKLQIRDKLNQDSDSYNTMISDLILAAQKIKMGSPNPNKRSSSIQLGSSSITSPAGNRWFGGSSGGGGSVVNGPKNNPTPTTAKAPTTAISGVNGTGPKRFSVL